jgi:integrase/recombinase XerC
MTTTATMTRTATAGPAVLKPWQVRDLLAAPDERTAHGSRDAALVAVLAGGGLRIGEACHLTIDSLEFVPDGRLRITTRTSKSKEGSTPRYRTVTLAASLARPIRRYVDRAAPRFWLFPGRHNEPLDTRWARAVIKDYLTQIGAGQYRVHDLRHTFASIVVRETRSIFVAQKLLGHTDPRTTAAYYACFDVSDADAAAEATATGLARRKGRRTS